MVVVRLARGGSHNRPYYYIVVTDSRARRDGRFIEKIGFYNPLVNSDVESFRIDSERVNHWVNVGAQLSPAVKKLIKSNKKPAEAAPAA